MRKGEWKTEKGRVRFLELGEQHFDDQSGTKHRNHTYCGVSDREKERQFISHNVPLLRLFQPSVWRDTCKWKSYIALCLRKSREGVLETAVYTQDHSVYTAGSYAAHRQIGSSCDSKEYVVLEEGMEGIPQMSWDDSSALTRRVYCQNT